MLLERLSRQLGPGAVWRQGLECSSYTGGQQAVPSMLGRQVIAPSSLLQWGCEGGGDADCCSYSPQPQITYPLLL